MKKFLLTLTLITSFLCADCHAYKYDLSVCAIFQNEAPYLKEWLDFHLYQGVEHFYLYNNNSSDDYASVLDWYIDRGVVTLTEWPYEYTQESEWTLIQCNAYMNAIGQMKKSTKWCAFIDTDEFLFSPDGKSLPQALHEYKQFSGIGVNWVMYGTSNVEKAESLIEELVFRALLNHPANKHVKTICRPSNVKDCVNPHFFIYKIGYAVNENKSQIDGCFCEFSANKLRINHYWVRDEKFLREVKQPRRERWGHEISKKELDELNAEFDDCINRL